MLAHLAASGKAALSQIRDLVGMQETAPQTALETVNLARAEAKLPPAPSDMCDSALQALSAQHADALAAGLLTVEGGAEFLAGIIRAAGGQGTERAVFLRHCSVAWERAKSGKLARFMELADPLEAELRDRPTPGPARKLADLILGFALETKPPREAARLLGLPHEASAEAMQHWQFVALDLNNRLDAPAEAATLLAALESGFADQGELGARIAENLAVCREREAAGDGTPAARRLVKAIAAALEDVAAFDSCGLLDGRTTSASPAVVVELYDSFIAAATDAKSDRPWWCLRGMILVLNNEHSCLAAAWSLTLLALSEAERSTAAAAVLPVLAKDKRVLRALVLQRDLDAAARGKRKGAVRSILAELIPLTDTPVERRSYEQALRKLKSQAIASYVKWGFWAVCGGGLAILSLVNHTPGNRTPVQAGAYRSAPASSVASSADRSETRPTGGEAALSISGLRWCRYQQLRLDGAEAYINGLRADPQVIVVGFNAAVAAYNTYAQNSNSSCGSYHYRKSDGLVIDAEVNEQAAQLRSAGRTAVERAYIAASSPAPVYSTPPAYAPTPAPPSVALLPPNLSTPSYGFPAPAFQQPSAQPPTAAANPYRDGQADRREWEAWVHGLAGANHDGAEWWASVRSASRPPSCAAAPGGGDPAAAVAGCNQARLRLATPDRRRRAEPDYRAGWNNP